MLIYEEIEELASRVEHRHAKLLLTQAAQLVKVPARTAKVRMRQRGCSNCAEGEGQIFQGTKKLN
jgi:hypothetical protein